MSKAGKFLQSINEDTKKDRMNTQIERHGNKLNAIFKTDLDPIKLSKKLFSLENKMHHANVQSINGDITLEQQEKVEKEVLDAVDKILGFRAKKIPVINNDDARGYALKIDSDWVHDKGVSIYTDMGGYGILAPNYREGA